MPTLLAPLALVLLALIPPVIALYLLKLRRQDRLVSSVYLWQRFVRDIEANAPWQRLRRNLLLFLQILLLLVLISALARPATPATGVTGQTVVLILDTSASMAATDGGEGGLTRLAAAQAAGRDLVTNAPGDTRFTLMSAAGGGVETLVSASQDRRQVLAALAAAEVTAQASDLGPALLLAEAIVARQPAAEIVLLSDGAIRVPAHLTAPVRFVPVGRSAANQALSSLALTTAATGEPAVFVQASNYGQAAARRRVVVEVDGAPFTAFDLDLPARGHAGRLVEGLPTTAQAVSAALQPAESDILALDDRAWAVLRPAGPVRVTLVTTGNTFLQTALSLLNPPRSGGLDVDLSVISPDDWSGQGANQRISESANDESAAAEVSNPPTTGPLGGRGQPSSVTIFDAFVPTLGLSGEDFAPGLSGEDFAPGLSGEDFATLPPGNLLFIAPPTSLPGLFEVLGQADQPSLTLADPGHPILQNADLAGTQILSAVALAPGDWARVLVTGLRPEAQPEGSGPGAASGPLPLLLAGERDGRRVAVLAFDIHQSDLPLRPAFPILVANLLTYLAPEAAGQIPPTLASGEALAIPLPPGVDRLRLVNPAGRAATWPGEGGRVTLPPLVQPGLYTVAFEPAGLRPGAQPEGADSPGSVLFAVNFFDPVESTIAPRPDPLGADGTSNTGQAGVLPPAYREWWRPLALAALALLVIEWLVYQRGNVVRYWSMVRPRN